MHTVGRVKEFHETFNHPVAERPTIPVAKQRLLRFRLLFEEVMEFGRAIGISDLCSATDEDLQEAMAHFAIDPDATVNMVDAADALADIDYVCAGANLVFGFPAEEIAIIVHNANMSKLGADGKPIWNEHGKVVKGPHTFSPEPFIEQMLDAMSKGMTKVG